MQSINQIGVAILMVCLSSPANAERVVMCTGKIGTGTLDSGVGDCGFLTKGPEADKIFKVCKMGDECRVRAAVDAKSSHPWIVRVIAVEKIGNSLDDEESCSAPDASNAGNTNIEQCSNAELARQDARLNGEYSALKAKLPAASVPALIQAQRAWLSFRDAWCSYEAGADSSRASDTVRAACIMELTKAHADRLKHTASADRPKQTKGESLR